MISKDEGPETDDSGNLILSRTGNSSENLSSSISRVPSSPVPGRSTIIVVVEILLQNQNTMRNPFCNVQERVYVCSWRQALR
jgi:hypothetical protein